MVTFRELEAIKLLLAGKPVESLPYHVFEDQQEYQDTLASLERKGYIKDGTISGGMIPKIESLFLYRNVSHQL